jgi:ABC-type polysaccharide/polyol phosphate transport system ATPase subunit
VLPFLRLRDVSVEFPIYSGGSRSLKKLLFNTTTQGNIARDARDRITVQALKQIDLDIKQGDRLALVGGNGAGKSTLLKVLAGIYTPSHGQVHISGRISALMTLSVGFNPDATGRENIINRAMYMDVRPREMRAQIDEIAEFSGLGYYIDMPVRTYSAGMMIRLCFAVATSVRPEILLMDEWLAAVDATFLAKAASAWSRLSPAAVSWCWPRIRCHCCMNGATARFCSMAAGLSPPARSPKSRPNTNRCR